MKLELGNFYVKDIVFGDKTKYENGILTVDKEDCLAFVKRDPHLSLIHIQMCIRDRARGEKEEAAGKVADWESKIRDYQEMIWRGERRVKEIMACLEQIQQEIGEAKLELGEQQEIIQWDQHEAALQMIDRGDHEKSGEIVKSLDSLKKLLADVYKRQEISLRSRFWE